LKLKNAGKKAAGGESEPGQGGGSANKSGDICLDVTAMNELRTRLGLSALK